MALPLPGMARWRNRVALVTGASVGIGACISKNMVEHGMIVIGCARRVEKIQELAKECEALGYPGKLIARKCDVTKDNDIEDLFAWIAEHHEGVDVCVNNAGFSYKEKLLEITGEQMRSMLDVNVVALVMFAKLAVKSMLARGVNDGHIFNINSLSGHRLTSSIHFYSSNKFAVTAITEGLRRELIENNNCRIRVSSISPGMTVSEFTSTVFGPVRGQEIYEEKKNLLEAQDVADAVLFALAAPERAQVHEIMIRPTGEPK